MNFTRYGVTWLPLPSFRLIALADEQLAVEIQRVWEEYFRVYGARKVWRQLQR